jgi:hypothetical protein
MNPEVAEAPEHDIYAGLDETPAAAPTPTPEPAPQPAPEPAATPAAAKPAPVEDDFGLADLTKKPEPAKKAEPAKKPEPAAKPTEASKGGLKEFREQYETTKKERDELAGKLAALEKAREEGTRAEVAKAAKEYEAKLSEVKKRNEELETELKYTNYTRSPEYSEKYQKPLENAWKNVLRDIDGYEIDTGDGSTRAASVDDIKQLVGMTALRAAKVANELFGDAAPEILAHRRRIVELTEQRQAAIEEYRTKGAEREREMQSRQSQQVSHVMEKFHTGLKAYEESHPEIFGRDSKDEEIQKAFDAGDRLVSVALKGDGLNDKSPDEYTELLTKAQAALAARARSFGPERIRRIRAEQKVVELEERLGKLTKSEPGQGSDAARRDEPMDEDITAGIDRL